MRALVTLLTALTLLIPAIGRAQVAVQDRYEVEVNLSTDEADPWTIPLEARVTTPDGSEELRPCFWHAGRWRFRYRPQAAGAYAVRFELDGAPIDEAAFTATDEGLPGPIAPAGYGFRWPDGAPFVPLGLNLGWSAGGWTEDYARWFASLSEVGGTFARIWITHFTRQDPEWAPLGTFDEEAGANVDVILDHALAEGVQVLLVLWQHSELEAMTWSSWDTNPYNAANGGPCSDSQCFFEDDEALAFQEVFLRYAVARWGPHPALFGFEVINETDAVQGVDTDVVVAWARQHAATIRELEGGLHPVSWSHSLPAQFGLPQDWQGADFPQVHCYQRPEVEQVAAGVRALLEAGERPVLVGEWGLDWMGEVDLEDADGLGWHQANWAAIASGSAGNAHTWWWAEHVEPDDLWWRLEGPARITAELDLPSMGPVDVQAGPGPIEVWARSNDEVALVWMHDRRVEAPTAAQPVPLSGVLLRVVGFEQGVATFFDGATGEELRSLEFCADVAPTPEFAGDLVAVVEAIPCEEGGEGCGCSTSPRASGLWGVLLVFALGLRRRRDGGF
jgi:MYXO-CTERM domain-containing protein